MPIIEGAAAVLQCQAHATHLIGDHHVWYGEVIDAKLDPATEGQHPLLYFARYVVRPLSTKIHAQVLNFVLEGAIL